MLAGAVIGAIAVIVYSLSQLRRTSRFEKLVLEAMGAMRLHLGRTSSIEGTIENGGWRFYVRCMGCKRRNRLPNGIDAAVCGNCKRPFKDTGNDNPSGTGTLTSATPF